MRFPLATIAAGIVSGLCVAGVSFASAYNARPKLIVIVVIDQFRGDYLARYGDHLGEGGFRLLTDHGAYFPDCSFDYANTDTAAGHATLLTGAYSDGHGILANQWWDPQKKRMVTSVEDDTTKLVGVLSSQPGASPHNLRSDTLGDELKLATAGKSRVFGIALERSGSGPVGGFRGRWSLLDRPKSGAWITSTFYRSELPRWVERFNQSQRMGKYLNQEWKDDQVRCARPSPSRESRLISTSWLARRPSETTTNSNSRAN